MMKRSGIVVIFGCAVLIVAARFFHVATDTQARGSKGQIAGISAW